MLQMFISFTASDKNLQGRIEREQWGEERKKQKNHPEKKKKQTAYVH